MVSLGLRFIIGPAGSGKTRYIVDRIVEGLLSNSSVLGGPEASEPASDGSLTGNLLTGNGPASRPGTILLAPDQSTFQMERLILQDPRIEGFMDLQVLSFRRLCLRVMEETGGLSLPFITAVGKSMAIQAILWEHRNELTAFAPLVNYPGFRATLGRTLSEMASYGVSPSSLAALAPDRSVPHLEGKVKDLSLVLDKFREFLAGRYSDPDDYLGLASERLRASGFLVGSTVYVDGFSGFTPAEYGVLEAIVATASQVTIALCADSREMRQPVNPASLFHPTREAYEKIRTLARRAGVDVEDTIYLPLSGEEALPRFRSAPQLGALERRFRLGARALLAAPHGGHGLKEGGSGGQVPGAGVPSEIGRPSGAEGQREIGQQPGVGEERSVRLISATNPLAELEFVAREVQRLVRDCGMRYRDITVEARDLTEYAGMLPLVFKDHNIPFFLDSKRSLSHHPLSELIRAALDVVLTNWSLDPVMRYLKTDLVPVDRSEVDILENYALSHGIAGERWISPEPWRYARKYLLREDEAAEEAEMALLADGIRRKATAALGRFYATLSGSRTGEVSASLVSGAVLDLLADLDVQSQISEWRRLAEAAGDLAEAGDHEGILRKVGEVLGQVREVLRDQTADLKTYSLLLAAGLEDIRLGAIPPSLDQVLVGSFDRSRQPECKVTFLIGALLGVFPKRQTEDSIFNDREREYLQRSGVEMEPASIQRQFHEQYLTYIALTRPSRMLYISYPLGDQEGKSLTPSHVVNMVKEALPGLEEETASVDPPGDSDADLDFVLPARVKGLTLRRLSWLREGGQVGDVWAEAYRYLLSPDRLPQTRRILASLSYSNAVAPLDHDLVRSLYGYTLHTSVSRLETFAACPFQHFARDGLSLKEREMFRLEPTDAGVFMHAALRGYVEEIARSGRDWGTLTPKEAQETVDSVVERLTLELSGELFASSARYRYISGALRRVLRRAADMLLNQIRRGRFRPVAAEVLFGFRGGPKPLRVSLSGKEEVLLRGQIDRIDAAAGPGGPLVRVVDYKSSPRNLDLLDVHSGLALQLLVYLLVVTQSWKEILGSLPLEVRAGLEGPATPAGALYYPIIDPIIASPGPVSEEDARKLMAKRLRMSGLVVRDEEIARLMDADGAGHSDIIPVQFLSGGGLSATSSAAGSEDFASLLGFVERKVGEMAARVFAGRVDIEPYRRGPERACQYCSYGPLCTFDVLIPGNRYRVIRPTPRESLWEEFRKDGKGGTRDA
ncbi:MAG: PD-(D/E)XK nuclease family protein [Bacillota bacterium]